MTTTPRPQPAIYLPHGGGPWNYMDEPDGTHAGLRAYLEALPSTLPQQPTAIVITTAHWEAPEFTVTSGQQPTMIYDYGGFPPHTYQVTYPAPGAPDIANRIAQAATQLGITTATDPDRGFDHGVFVPLAVSWPNANIPVVAISLKQGLDPEEHLAFGVALQDLRYDNIVVIGSGLSIHDLTFRITPTQAAEFDHWLEETMNHPPAQRAQRLKQWTNAPSARQAHPREDHLLPLMTITGAGGNDQATRTYHQELYGLKTAAYNIG